MNFGISQSYISRLEKKIINKMKKEIKMNVVGYDNIIVNTETGVISGKTYPAKDWIKRNFEAKWNKEDKVWMADPELIKEELTKNAHYYEKYIVSEDEPEEVEEEAKEESAEEVKEKSAEESKGNEEDEIVEQYLENRNDGFYWVTVAKSGKINRRYVG